MWGPIVCKNATSLYTRMQLPGRMILTFVVPPADIKYAWLVLFNVYRSLVGLWLAYAVATGESIGAFMAILATVRALASSDATSAGALE